MGGNGGKRGKGCQGTYIKDTRTKSKVGRMEGERWGWLGLGVVVGGKWRQLYLNDNKKQSDNLNKQITMSGEKTEV